ncbi:MAG: TIM barrel protein, partial [Clostridia bacterium]|nr:TIM barrel protein [Clostridia bacterium]
MSLPVALQLYSVRDAFKADAVGTLKKVKEMGYSGVEFAGLFDNDPAALRKELDALGLKAISAHVSIDQLTGDIDKVIRDYKVLGCEYIAIPWLDAKTMLTPEAFPQTIETFTKIGEKLTAAGFVMLYHNHNFEFKIVGGKYILDMIYSEIPASLLQTELDTCWVNVG